MVPLRGVRRALKDPPAIVVATDAEALRARVKAIELEAERLQQEALYAAFPLGALGVSEASDRAARANVAAYETSLGATFDPDAVETLLAAFDKLGDGKT